MKTMFIDLAILLALGFVPNQRNPQYHTAFVTIGGHTVWCKNAQKASKIANRVLSALCKRGVNPEYMVGDMYGNKYM